MKLRSSHWMELSKDDPLQPLPERVSECTLARAARNASPCSYSSGGLTADAGHQLCRISNCSITGPPSEGMMCEQEIIEGQKEERRIDGTERPPLGKQLYVDRMVNHAINDDFRCLS